MERGWKLPLLLLGVLGLAAIASFVFLYDPDDPTPPALAEAFDPTGRTQPGWAINEDPREDASTLRIVEYTYTTTNGRQPSVWTNETWVEFDDDGRPLRAAGINHSTSTLDWYADRDGGWQVGCHARAVEHSLLLAVPWRPEIDGMLASGFEEVALAPIALPPDAPEPDITEATPQATTRLEAQFQLDGAIKTRTHLLDDEGRGIGFRGATVVGGEIVSERITFVTELEFDAEVSGRIDGIEQRLTDCDT